MAPVGDHHAALRAHFAFGSFRPGQEVAVVAALAGRDVLVVMPTGAGKSLCYQLPALMRTDLTVVVSPLVSLMADQAQSLGRRAPGAVALVNGQQDRSANASALAAALRGELRVLHVAPERFSAPGFLETLAQAHVGLFVVDEAHCVSEWGHDFRPDYLRLGDVARRLGAVAIVASTATATPHVAADIVARLGLHEPVRVATGFDRPNLSFTVVPAAGSSARAGQALAVLREPDATPAIVYAGTRRAVDELAQLLGEGLGRPVVAYHAGLGRAERAQAQARFMGGDADVVVATSAFGMGVDKADVRTVVHASVPPSVEAYYQEAGRAGRDGAPARAVLLAAAHDKGLHVSFVRRAEVTDEHVASVAAALQAAAGGPPVTALPGLGGAPPSFDVGVHELLDDDRERVRSVVGVLTRAGVVVPSPALPDRVRGRLVAAWTPEAATRARALTEDADRARWRRYHAVWAFVAADRCRRAALLAHFGDPAAPAALGPCCDVCDPRLAAVARAAVPARTGGGTDAADLDAAILAIVAVDGLSLGRRDVVAILRGGRSPAVRGHNLDGLPAYGTWEHVAAATIRGAVERLLVSGDLVAGAGDALALSATPGRIAA